MVQAHPNTSSIVDGPETADYHLNTYEDIECVHCYRPHFYGQSLDEVGIYCELRHINPQIVLMCPEIRPNKQYSFLFI